MCNAPSPHVGRDMRRDANEPDYFSSDHSSFGEKEEQTEGGEEEEEVISLSGDTTASVSSARAVQSFIPVRKFDFAADKNIAISSGAICRIFAAQNSDGRATISGEIIPAKRITR